jgi:hypothetical protein
MNGEPVDGVRKRRKRTVSIRRFRVNSDGTKTLVSVFKPPRKSQEERKEPTSVNTSIVLEKKPLPILVMDIKPINEKNSYINRLESKL